LAKTPINTQSLAILSQNYNKLEAEFLNSGFNNGFSLHYLGPRDGREAKNLKSAMENPDILEQKIKNEINEGRVAGPFKTKPFKNLIISPLGLVPKQQAGEFRLIHHLSFPDGSSVNDYIDPSLTSVQYTNFDEAIKMIQKFGRGCHLFKIDLKSAFRLIPVAPKDFHLLGFSFEGKYYFDKALPFGSSISCAIFERFAKFLLFCVKSRLHSGALMQYLDDYLGGNRTAKSCQENMKIFHNTAKELGVPIANEKTVGPTKVLVFLGLELDSENMQVRIPTEKVEQVIEKIVTLSGKQKTNLKSLQSLIGSLNFCCRAIPMGRPFCRRLIDKTCGLTRPYHHCRITKEMKRDLQMWLTFFQDYNGISVFHDQFWLSNADVSLFSDSAGGVDKGFGVVFGKHWCQATWPQAWWEFDFVRDITVLELFPIVVALFVWGDQLENKKIEFNCDNIAVVHIINKLSSKSEPVMKLVRALTIKCLFHNIVIKAKHVPGIQNDVCDALSRFQMDRFKQLAPDANPMPDSIPPFLWNIFSTELDNLSLPERHQTHN